MKKAFLTLLLVWPASSLWALGFPTLSDGSAARPIALGEAFNAVSDDITALHYNPASLSSLRFPQASVFYEKGVVEDTYGRLSGGFRNKNIGYGGFVSYYNEGTLEFYDVNSVVQLQGRQETAFGLASSVSFSNFRMGLTGKHISSQIIEGVRADAVAFDAGTQMEFSGKKTLGLSVHNIGTSVEFGETSFRLPRNAQLGFSSPFSLVHVNGLLLTDVLYDMNEKETIPLLGLEVAVGPLFLRGGLKSRDNGTEYSFGSGFGFSRLSVDYALVFAPLTDSQHKFSLNMTFGPDPRLIEVQATEKGLEYSPYDPKEKIKE